MFIIPPQHITVTDSLDSNWRQDHHPIFTSSGVALCWTPRYRQVKEESQTVSLVAKNVQRIGGSG